MLFLLLSILGGVFSAHYGYATNQGSKPFWTRYQDYYLHPFATVTRENISKTIYDSMLRFELSRTSFEVWDHEQEIVMRSENVFTPEKLVLMLTETGLIGFIQPQENRK